MSGGHPPFFSPRVFVPFAIITLIWGSTWLVIKDQLGVVPPTWSVAYRFMIAGAATFVVAAASGQSLRIGREGHMLALAFGLPQFSLNFNMVYLAEQHVTSGLVAVVFALLMVPNTAFGRLFLKHPISRQFLIGSAVAAAGVALLFVQEIRASGAEGDEVLVGIALTLVGVLSASIANVMQAGDRLRARPVMSMLAWGMLYGVIANVALALLLYGPPVVETRPTYWAGLAYLGLIASALAFTLYFRLIRIIGPGKAAYTSLIVPMIAMTLSTIFEGYRWSTLAVAGGVLALAGLIMAMRSRPVAG